MCLDSNDILHYYVDEDGHFGQQEVPLTDEISTILQEYPDGQIFKVSDHPCLCE